MDTRLFKIILLLALVMISPRLAAQTFTLSGRVVDENSNPIEFASVSVPKQGRATMTNLKGAFSMQLQSADSVEVRFSMIGYKTKVKVLRRPRSKQTFMIVLHSDNELAEVVVTEQRKQTGTTQKIEKKDIKNMPSTTGNAVEELIKSQAGVSSHDELSSQYNVRGGSFDENCVYINNVEIYRPFLVRSGQQEGLSIINPDMVESINFSTGGFEAKYGDKMSSVLDIKYRRPKRFEASVSASLLGTNAYVGFANKKMSWSNSVRYKTNRYLLGSLETKGEYRPNFLDYQTYFSYKPHKKWTIDFIGNISDNHYNFTPEDRETKFGTLENVKDFKVYFDGQEKDLFRTFFGTLGITGEIDKNTKVSLHTSAFHTREQEKYDIQGQYWLTQTETSEELGVGTYMEHARNYLKANVQSIKLSVNHKRGKHDINAGFTYKIEKIDENSMAYEMRDSSGYSIPHTGEDLNLIYTLKAKNKLKAQRSETYIQDTYKFNSRGGNTFFTLNYGLRMSHWNFNHETILSPRVSLGIVPAFNHDVVFRVAAGLYYQAPFYKELRDTTSVDGVTMARLNDKIKSQRSIHFIGGADYRFKMRDRNYKLSAEIYYKALNDLIPYSVNNVKITYDGQNKCSGHAMGIDLKLYGEFVPGTDSWVSFSFMNARQKLNGKSIPLPTDQRYAINMFFTDYFPGTDKWKMSLKLAYADGLPFGPPHKGNEMMSFRAPAYKRADIGMSYRAYDSKDSKKKKLIKNIWVGLDCLNLFGISNVNSYYWITDVMNQQYAIPNFLTGRQINTRVLIEF